MSRGGWLSTGHWEILQTKKRKNYAPSEYTSSEVVVLMLPCKWAALVRVRRFGCLTSGTLLDISMETKIGQLFHTHEVGGVKMSNCTYQRGGHRVEGCWVTECGQWEPWREVTSLHLRKDFILNVLRHNLFQELLQVKLRHDIIDIHTNAWLNSMPGGQFTTCR